jgi:DNA-binding NtrC family response regulator
MSNVRTLADVEREAIFAALLEIKHVVRAAKALGISANTLYNRMQRYGIKLDRTSRGGILSLDGHARVD